MRRVVFDPEALAADLRPWWNNWTASAAEARDEHVAAVRRGAAGTFAPAVWRAFRQWLLSHFFFNKCAYCEGLVGADAASDDADHFRPKGRVLAFEADTWRIVRRGGTPHPGYYWLAYEWWNILPSCNWCNRISKGSRFPIAGEYVWSDSEHISREDLDEIERPLLLNPLLDESVSHITYLPLGLVAPSSERGRFSIMCYGLNRETLVEQRRKAQDAARDQIALTVLDAFREGTERVRESLSDIVGERAVYTSSIYAAVVKPCADVGGLLVQIGASG